MKSRSQNLIHKLFIYLIVMTMFCNGFECVIICQLNTIQSYLYTHVVELLLSQNAFVWFNKCQDFLVQNILLVL